VLPIFITSDRSFVQMQNTWSSQLEPVINNPLASGILLQNVPLVSGSNAVNHTLGRRLVGWYVTRIRAVSDIFDTQDSNNFPALTLNLTASAPVLVDIYVF